MSIFTDADFKYRQKQIDNVIIQDQLKIVLPLVKEGVHAKYIASKINVDINVLFDWYIKGYAGDETFKEFSECYWENRMKDSIPDFQSLFDKGISEKFFLKIILNKNVIPEYKFWKKLGVFNYTNKILTDEEQFEIVKENVIDVKENVKNILESIDEDSDLEVPLEEIIEDLDDADAKRLVKNYLEKRNDEK